MAFRGGYFHASLLILRIILKSKGFRHDSGRYSSLHRRIILATIKYLGNCLCPLCTCPKEKVRDLGTRADDLCRSIVRVDSEERQRMVYKAREWIFKCGRAVTSDAIDVYLKFSMVPICVCSHQNAEITLIFINRMPSPKRLVIGDLISIKCSLSISFTTSNLVFGKVSLHTWFGFSTLAVKARSTR
jgi:hypothetical protein